MLLSGWTGLNDSYLFNYLGGLFIVKWNNFFLEYGRVSIAYKTLIFFSLFLLAGLGTAVAQDHTDATLDIEDAQINKSEITQVNLTALNVTDLANFAINITYDPSVINITNAINNPVFETEVNNLVYADKGWVMVGSLNKGAGQSGDVLLSTLTVKAVGEQGDTTSLNLTADTFINSSEADVPVKIDNGSVNIPPFATLDIEDAQINKSEITQVNLTALNVTDLANFAINITYDPSVINITNAINNPVFETEVNNLVYADKGWVMVGSLNKGAGQSGDVLLSTLTVKAVGEQGDTTSLNLTADTFINSSEADVPVKIDNGSANVAGGLPDYTVLNLSQNVSDDSIKLNMELENVGYNTTKTSTIRLKVDGETYEDIEIPGMPSSKKINLERSVKFNTAGEHNVTVIVDANDDVSEINETNNTQEITLVISDFVLKANAQPERCDRNNPISISGVVESDNGDPIPSKTVYIEIIVKGYSRSFLARTNETGKYSFQFKPLATEAGLYTVDAQTTVDGLNKHSEDTFIIDGLLFNPHRKKVSVIKGTTNTISVSLNNIGDTELTNISINLLDLNSSDSISANLSDGTLNILKPGRSHEIKITLSSQISSPEEALFRLTAQCDQKASDSGELYTDLYKGDPVLKAEPNILEVSTNPARSVVRTVNITNIGYANLEDVELVSSDLEWVLIQENKSLGDISPGEGKSFDVVIYPPNDILGKYSSSLEIQSSNHKTVTIPMTITVTKSKEGAPSFKVKDNITETNVSNAKVTLVSKEAEGIFYENITQSEGLTSFEDIPIGKYDYRVTAENYESSFGEIYVEPANSSGRTYEVMLNPDFLDIAWNVERTTIEDRYNVTLGVTLNAEVPTPVIQAIPSDLDYTIYPNQTISNQRFKLHNLGLIPISDVKISTNLDSGLNLNLLSNEVTEIKPNESVDIPFTVGVSPHTSNGVTLEGKINITGEFLYKKDNVSKMVRLDNVMIDLEVKVPSTSLVINPSKQSLIVEPGETQRSTIKVKNISPYSIDDVQISTLVDKNVSIDLLVNNFHLNSSESKKVPFDVSVSSEASWDQELHNLISINGIEQREGGKEVIANTGVDVIIPDRKAGILASTFSATMEPGDVIEQNVSVANYVVKGGNTDKRVPIKNLTYEWDIKSNYPKDIDVNELRPGSSIGTLDPGERKEIEFEVSANSSARRGETTYLIFKYNGSYVGDNNELVYVNGSATSEIRVPELGLVVNPRSLVTAPALENAFQGDFNFSITDVSTYHFTVTNPHIRDATLFSPALGVAIDADLSETTENMIMGNVSASEVTKDLAIDIGKIIVGSPYPNPGFSISVYRGWFLSSFGEKLDKTSISRDESASLGVRGISVFGKLLPSVYDGEIKFNYKWDHKQEKDTKSIPVQVLDIGILSRAIMWGFSNYTFEEIDPPSYPGIEEQDYDINYGPKLTDYTEAKVRIELSQSLALERESFEAEAGLTNKLDEDLQDVDIDIEIRDNNGSIANDKFFIQPPALTNIDSTDNGTIKASSTASLKWLIIPKTGAGGKDPSGQNYSVQMKISGNANSSSFVANSKKINITVKPQPKLNLTYYLPEEIEPNEPFHLAVEVNNSGHGWARNLEIESAQPKIVDNEGDLLLNFEIMSDLKVNIGDVPPGGIVTSYWELKSNVGGEFTNFTANFTHDEALGGEATSLIEDVNTEILGRELSVTGMKIPYSVDTDGDGIPDKIKDLTEPDSERSVYKKDHTITEEDKENKTMEVSTAKAEDQWIFLDIPDMFNNERSIKSVVRSDGVVLDQSNYWIEDGKVRIIDDPGTTYTIQYSREF